MLLECLCQRVQVSTVDGGLEEVDGVCDYQKTAKGRQEISFYPQCVYLHVGAQCMELLLWCTIDDSRLKRRAWSDWSDYLSERREKIASQESAKQWHETRVLRSAAVTRPTGRRLLSSPGYRPDNAAV